MKEFQYTVKDACGIHARPAGLLVKVAKGFASTATLEKDGKSCDMRKLMALMGMGIKGNIWTPFVCCFCTYFYPLCQCGF